MNKRKYRNCCVFGCLNTTKTNLTFFRLPDDVERRVAWLKLIQREDLINNSSGYSYVCEEHFETESILTSPNRKILKKNSIPKCMLPNSQKEDKETQVVPETSDSYTQHEHVQTDSISQTMAFLSCDTPRKRKLKEKLIESRKNVKRTQSKENDTNIFFKLCDKFLSKKLANVVKEQTELKFHCPANRYSTEYKMFCLSLYYTSPQAYNLLKATLCLPAKATLKRMNLLGTTSINKHLMNVLKAKVDQMTDLEKNCSLVVDAMSLKANLFYNIKEDKIHGFQEIDGVQSPSPAKYALVATIHGIFENYEQPVGYALLAECKNYESRSEWINKLITKLFEIGLNIRVFITDLGSDFLNSAKKRAVSRDTPYFFVGDRKIYYIFDPPHLIKLVRNDLMTYDFHFENFVAKWDHIVQFYEKDKTKQLRLAPKLTNSHISPNTFEKMKVRYAVQVLSNTVAAGISTYIDFNMFDQLAGGTVKLITIMNDLFDLLNSSTLHGKSKFQSAFCNKDFQTSFFNYLILFFNSLKLINPKNGQDATSKVKFIEGFQITIKSILFLFEDLRTEGCTFLLTRRLNQDCLDNIFGQIRTKNGNSTEPTSWQLVSAFRKKCFINILKPSKKGNCADLGILLIDGDKSYTDSVKIIQREHINIFAGASDEEQGENVDVKNLPSVSTTDYSTLDLPEKNSLMYICGYLLKKCLEKHKDCELLKSHVKSVDSAQNFTLDTSFIQYKKYCKEGGPHLLIIPQDDFVIFIEKMEEIFCAYFKNKYINCQILAGLLKDIENLSFITPCGCFPLLYLKKLYLRMRIYYTLKYNNRVFHQCCNRRKYFSITHL